MYFFNLLRFIFFLIKIEVCKLRLILIDLEKERLFTLFGKNICKNNANPEILRERIDYANGLERKIESRHKCSDHITSLRKELRSLYNEIGEIAVQNKITGPSMEYIYFKIRDILYKRSILIDNIRELSRRKENPVIFIPLLFGMLIVFIAIILLYILN